MLFAWSQLGEDEVGGCNLCTQPCDSGTILMSAIDPRPTPARLQNGNHKTALLLLLKYFQLS